VFGGLAVVLGSNVIYHVALKSMPRAVDPFLATATAYVVALVTTLSVWAARGGKVGAVGAGVREMNWTNLVVGVAIVGVELGFLLVYRAGGDVSKSSALTSTALAMLLALIGLTLFAERLSPAQWTGLLLCGSGIVLLARG
jgi:uncharacterized membrane protein